MVHLDLRHLGEKLINAKLPFVRELCMKYENIDPVTELIPVRPVVHYMMGGVSTDINGATPLGGLFAARLLLGIGEAPTFPGNAKAVGYWFPKSERSLATATFDAMAKFASAIGVPILGLLLLHFGWRYAWAVM